MVNGDNSEKGLVVSWTAWKSKPKQLNDLLYAGQLGKSSRHNLMQRLAVNWQL